MSWRDISGDALRFTEVFFGDGNDLKWSYIVSLPDDHTTARFLEPWLYDIGQRESRPVILPRATGGHTIWYAIPRRSQDVEILREDLQAFIGPSYTDYVGQAARLDDGDDLESAVRSFSPLPIFRFTVTDPSNNASVREAIRLMHRLWSDRPHREHRSLWTTEALLRKLDVALIGGDQVEAERQIQEIERLGRLNAKNLVFLRIRVLFEGQRWDELLRLPELLTMLDTRCPQAVIEAVIGAVYHNHLWRHETEGDPQAALRTFRCEVLPRWSSLFRTRASMSSPEALKSFMLFAADCQPPRTQLRDAIVADPALRDEDRPYLEQLARLVPQAPKPAIDPMQRARNALMDGDYDLALPSLLEAPASVEQVILLIQAAEGIGTLEASRIAVEAAGTLDPKEFARLDSRPIHAAAWERLSQIVDTADVASVPSDWLAWIERLNEHGPWSEARMQAERGAEEWSPHDLAADPERVAALADAVMDESKRLETGSALFDHALPHLVGNLTRDGALLPRFKDLLLALVMVISDEARVSTYDLGMVFELLRSLIRIGPSSATYQEYLSVYRELWDRFHSAQQVDWVLDVLDDLIDAPVASEADRFALVNHVLIRMASITRRLSPDQRFLLQQICRDLDLSDAFDRLPWPEHDTAESEAAAVTYPRDLLAGKTIGIYTLTCQPARRLRDLLQDRFDDVSVKINHDTKATDALGALARGADVMIMVTWSATHAATRCITSRRDKEKPLLMPRGKYFPRLKESVYEYLDGLFTDSVPV